MTISNLSTKTNLTIDNVRENILGIDTRVPVFDGSLQRYVNLDNAASTPSLKPVFEKVTEFMQWYSSIHRGTGFKSQVSTHVYEEAHEIALNFVKADPASNTVIFGKNASESLNKLAHSVEFKPGEVVLTTIMEHHSNDLPWRATASVKHVRVDKNGALDQAHLDAMLNKYAGHVRMVVVTGASNVTGYINPIHEIAEKVHRAGAEILVDAAQLAPHRAIDVYPNDHPRHIDYLVTAAHKMYAPFGSSTLIGKKETFLQGDPDVVGGGTVDIVTVDHVKWAGLPDREEAGSPNVVGAVAQAKTMLCLQEMGMEAIAEHEARLTAYLLRKLAKMDDVIVYGITDPARVAEKVGVVPITVVGKSHYLVAAILSHEGAIGVRNGCFCAHPYLFSLLNLDSEQTKNYQQQIINNNRSQLPGLVRISFGCYNNEEDVDRLIDTLERIVHNEYKGEYIQDPVRGEYRPKGFKSNLAEYFSLE
ncbi:MAG: aminotransferase class V-fold PLP-dependent enzyme [Chloroflexi bacterium]|nr:aminotransferase class V-fold PLP-dependent enzyme [Chloroflexota bacterium]